MATYKQIQAEIKKRYGYSAVTGWIAHVKEHHGLTTRTAHNRIDPTKRVNPCPSKKWKDIEKVMQSFGMIKQPKKAPPLPQIKKPKKTPPLPQIKYHPQIQYSKGGAKKVVLKSTDDSSWYWLIQQAIRHDGNSANKEPAGWHWLIFLHYILEFNVADIQKKLPDSHPLKSASLPTNATKSKYKPVINEFNQRTNFTAGSERIFFRMSFSNLIIKDPLLFSNFIFPITVDFTHSEFSQGVLFNNTVFFGDSDFSNATFFEDAEFSNATFLGKTAKFSGAVFEQIANFNGATFQAYANFKKSQLKGRTNFQRAKFKFHAPRFYGATFNNEITFFGLIPPKFKRAINEKPNEPLWDIIWATVWATVWAIIAIICVCEKKKKIKDIWADIWADRKEKKKRYKDRLQENQNSYENTAILLEENNKYHDEHFFFRQEMRCRRRLGRNPFIRFPYTLYEWLSDYGYGVGWAILWWASHILIGAVILFTIRYFNCFKDFTHDFGCSLGISLSNSHAFFFKGERLEKCYKAFENLPWFNFIWGVQTITGTLLIFLVLLTLRVRFRLK